MQARNFKSLARLLPELYSTQSYNHNLLLLLLSLLLLTLLALILLLLLLSILLLLLLAEVVSCTRPLSPFSSLPSKKRAAHVCLIRARVISLRVCVRVTQRQCRYV